jgi:hypothetical protein
LYITISSRQAPDRACAGVIAYATYRAVAHDAPQGYYPAIVQWRSGDPHGPGDFTVIARRFISVVRH